MLVAQAALGARTAARRERAAILVVLLL